MEKEQHFSFLEQSVNPIIQATGIFVAGLFVTTCAKLIEYTEITYVGERFPWLCAAAFLLFFSLFNSVSSLSVKDLNEYWTKSMMAFVALAVCSGFAAYLISNIPISEAGSYRWIFIVLTFGYLVFLSMSGFIKRIVEFAEREDWQSPKKPK